MMPNHSDFFTPHKINPVPHKIAQDRKNSQAFDFITFFNPAQDRTG
jgi:hypothetical protein